MRTYVDDLCQGGPIFEIVEDVEGIRQAAPSTPTLAERLAVVVPRGEPVEIPGLQGATPNFSGASHDARLVELWLAGKSPRTRQAYALDLARSSPDSSTIAAASP
jgi:hypothetical protein